MKGTSRVLKAEEIPELTHGPETFEFPPARVAIPR